MTEDEFNSAFQAGYERVEHYVKQGINLFSFGEMGLDKASIVSDSEVERVRKIVAHVGGFDIAAILGAMLACVEFKKPFVIDGFITAVAAACAVHMNERITDYALPSHHSREKGTELALAEVDITQDMVPIQAHMSMGEGTGAILMVQMLKTTQHMFVNVGTFADLMKL